jgi:hypothetical protein
LPIRGEQTRKYRGQISDPRAMDSLIDSLAGKQ